MGATSARTCLPACMPHAIECCPQGQYASLPSSLFRMQVLPSRRSSPQHSIGELATLYSRIVRLVSLHSGTSSRLATAKLPQQRTCADLLTACAPSVSSGESARLGPTLLSSHTTAAPPENVHGRASGRGEAGRCRPWAASVARIRKVARSAEEEALRVCEHRPYERRRAWRHVMRACARAGRAQTSRTKAGSSSTRYAAAACIAWKSKPSSVPHEAPWWLTTSPDLRSSASVEPCTLRMVAFP